MQLPVWKERGSKLSIAFLDIKSLLKTIDLLSINESNTHNGDLPSPQNVHVLLGKALNKTITSIFSTVGPWGLFRPFLFLRAWKQTSGGSQVTCAVSEKSLRHTWGLRFRLHRKSESLSSHSHSNHIPQHEYRTTSSFIIWLGPQPLPSGSWILFDGSMPCLRFENWLTAPHKSTVSLLQVS